MTTMLQQAPDGRVYVRTEGGTYGDTLENFAKDHGSPFPALDTGLTERIYQPDVRHALIAHHNVVDGGPMPWPEGDAIIAAITALLAAQAARIDAETPDIPPTPTPKDPGIISDRQFFQALANQGAITKEEALAAVQVGAVPATLQAFIDAHLADADKFAAQMLLSGAVEFHREHPLVKALGTGMGWTDEQLDELWLAASKL